MLRTRNWIWYLLLCLIGLVPTASAQNTGAQLTGTITDPTGAVVPGAEVVLTSVDTGVALKITSSPDGLYSFFNLTGGHFELAVTLKGFREFVQRGVRIGLNEKARIDVKLELGAETQQVEVTADASALNYETVEQSGGVPPDTVNELPLIITSGSGGLRSAAQFMSLLPGVVTQDGDVLQAHMNGAQKYAGDALLNGVALTNPSGGNGAYSAAFDFGQSPEMVSELKVITANYEPQYGSTGGSIFIMETKSGTNAFHGNAFWFHRNDALNARQWNSDEKPRDLEHDFGGSIGGPVKVPLLWSSKNKTYFFFDFEGFRQKGGASRAILSIPSMQERQGDFRDWTDANGNLIPIYDPATTHTVNGQVVRDQFMGCDGHTPNVICPDRIQNSLAYAWLKYLPTPTFPGPLNNFIALDTPTNFYSHTNHYNIRVDEYLGDKDHFFVTVYHRQAGPTTNSELPKEISNQTYVYKRPWANRLSWDHTFSPVLLNHFGAGYQDDYYNGGSLAAPYADLFPKIPGASRYAYPPSLGFSDGFQSFKGDNRGTAEANKWPAPAYIFNDLVTWVKGKHTFKAGAEFRTSSNTYVFERNEAGTFNFARGQTGLLTNLNSGSPIASFLLEQVDSASVDWRPYGLVSARFQDYITHFGDTWKVTPKLSLNLGIRWEMHPPSHEVHDVFSFLDPNGANPGAGGRPGRLAFAGTRWGDVSYGARFPEQTFKKAFSPRVGIAYSVSPKLVVRTGYGIFYDAGITPNWQGGIGVTGFNLTKQFGNSLGGLAPAIILSQGMPTDYQKPPFLDPSYNNGQYFDNYNSVYRPLDGNRLPYSQQWSLSVEREVTPNFTISASYVGTKGTHLYSRTAPINALDPKLLSMGNALYDEFQPGQTVLDGVNVPYAGWVDQMTGCSPSVAQALLPYPQYCGNIFGLTETAGNSTFHSLQMKAEKRFTNGFWLLGSYTWSKLLTDAESTQPDEGLGWEGGGSISPFERARNKSLSLGDIPHTFVLSTVYDLPVGKGKHWLSNVNPVVDGILGGWRVSSILRLTSGTPYYFRSSTCNVPGQFAVACIPAILPGANPWAQDKSNFNPDQPLFNVAAFEPVDRFNFYYGVGPRVSNLRGFGYHNQDFSLTKRFRIKEKLDFQVRGDFFNLWNWHLFRSINTDIASPDFGMQQGPSSPRFVQVGAKVNF